MFFVVEVTMSLAFEATNFPYSAGNKNPIVENLVEQKLKESLAKDLRLRPKKAAIGHELNDRRCFYALQLSRASIVWWDMSNAQAF